jgi:hypothetical protein
MRYSAETTAPAGEIMRRAREAFGPTGAGLQLTSTDLLNVTYSHPSGYVSVNIEPNRGGNTVVVETREFDDPAVRFLGTLPRRSLLSQLVRRFRRSKT